MNKKKLVILIIIIVVLLIVILPLILFQQKSINNIESLSKALIKEFPELNLRVMEKDEIMNHFGIILDDDLENLFVTDYSLDNDKPFSPNVLIVIINNSNYKEISDALNSYIDSEISNTSDIERVKLYQNAVIESKGEYYYLVIGNDKNIIRIIDNYIK